MHKYLYIISIFTMAASLNAIAADTLYVGGSGGSTETAFREKIIPSFEAKTGIKVVYVPGNSTDILAKLQAQKDRPEISVAMIDDGPMNYAVEFGLCAKLEEGAHSKNIYSNARMIGDRSTGIGFIATGLVYNTEVFKKNGWAAPTSWADLENKKYAGKVVIPPITNGYGLLTLIMTARLNGGGENAIDPGFEAMQKRIGPNVLAWEPSPGKLAELLQTGEAALGVWGNGRVHALEDQGAPVKFVYPKEGAVAIMIAACAVQNAPQPKQAQAFMQHILSPETQKILAEDLAWGPVNKETRIAPEAARKVVFGPEQVGKLINVDYKIINAKRGTWTARWNRVVER